jgi:hypothetical protein
MIVAMSLVILLAASALGQEKVVRRPDGPLEIAVWTNKAEGKSFGQGEHIIIYFRANRDCFVTIYDLDTRGNVNLLFPYNYDDPIYIEGNRVYTIPDYFDEYELAVEGPPGTEYIQAVASLDPIDVPQWPSKFLEYDDYYPLHADREPVEFLHYVNHRYFPLQDCYKRCATDYASFEVRRDWSYDWDAYYDVNNVYYYQYYDPWDWCGSVYVGYPYGASIWIDGFFYGYAPCFVPRVVVGWHNMGIWYNDYYWYYGQVNVCAGYNYDYVCDDIRYKDSYKHYGFKPKPRGSSQHVAEKYYPDRRKTVYTRDAGYVSKSTYTSKYADKSNKRSRATVYKSPRSGSSKGSGYSAKGRSSDISSKSGTGKSGRKSSGWDEYNKPKPKSDPGKGSKKSSGYNSKGSSKKGSSKKSGSYNSKDSSKKGSSKKSSGSTKSKGSGSKKSSGYSKSKGSSSKGSSGYSGSKGGSRSSSGSSSKGSSRSGGGKKGGGKRR